jgi:type IV pilus assembly protein PilB
MKKLGEILLEKKILTKEELAQLLAKQQITRERLGDLVVKAGFLTTESLLNIVAEQYGLQYFNLKELVIPVALQKEVNFEILKKYRVVPVKLEDKKLFLGINDVSLLKDIDEIAFNLGKTIVPVLLSEISIDRILVDLEKLPYGTKDYQFKSLELIMQGGKNFDTLIITILDYDDKIERIFIKENAPPFIKKSNMIEKIPYDSFTKSQILNIIKEVCDENERRSLVSNGFVSVKRSIMSKRFTLNFYKEKNSFFILVINHSS